MNNILPLLFSASRLLLVCLVITGIAGCAFNAVSPSGSASAKLMIRVRNDSTLDIDNFWLGAGPRGGSTGNTSFGAIKQGTASRYHRVEPNLDDYRKMNFVADGQRYLDNIDPQAHIGQAELPIGWYTFAYDIVNGEPRLTITEDPAP